MEEPDGAHVAPGKPSSLGDLIWMKALPSTECRGEYHVGSSFDRHEDGLVAGPSQRSASITLAAASNHLPVLGPSRLFVLPHQSKRSGASPMRMDFGAAPRVVEVMDRQVLAGLPQALGARRVPILKSGAKSSRPPTH